MAASSVARKTNNKPASREPAPPSVRVMAKPAPTMQRKIAFVSMPACSQDLIERILEGYFEEHYTATNSPTKQHMQVIMYRHPLVSAVHDYWKQCNTVRSFKQKDSPEQWHRLWNEHRSMFKDFFAKNLKPGRKPNQFFLETDRYIQGPFKPLCDLIAFISPDQKPDIYKIADLLGKNPYPKDKSILSLQHYDMDEFKAMEKEVLDELNWLNISTYFMHE